MYTLKDIFLSYMNKLSSTWQTNRYNLCLSVTAVAKLSQSGIT